MITLAKPEPISDRVREKLNRLHGARKSRRTLQTIAWCVALLVSLAALALGRVGRGLFGLGYCLCSLFATGFPCGVTRSLPCLIDPRPLSDPDVPGYSIRLPDFTSQLPDNWRLIAIKSVTF